MQATPPPDGLWAGLDTGVPITLLPVRLETRFGTRAAQAQDGSTVLVGVLRVRIYPDDVSVLPSVEGLWKAERAAGEGFWQAQVPKQGEDADAFDHRRVAAWDVLVRQVGAQRATFVATQTRDGAAPHVPGREDKAPSAHLLPDAWVVLGERDGVTEFVHHVPRSPGDPQTGPSRSPGADAFTQDDALLVRADDGMRWLTDFAAAVEVGMAAEIDLETPEQAQSGQHPAVMTSGLSSLYVVGVRQPTGHQTVDDEAVALADLLTRHATLDKLALVAQGTATNNLTDRPSGWSSAIDPYAGYHRLIDPAAAPGPLDAAVPVLHGGATDGAILEAALGVSGVTAGLEGADRHEQWLARAMALVTFPVTFGEVLGELGQHVIYDEQRYERQLDEVMPWARDHVASYVRGRGPLPVVRVGRNPYGVLPVMTRSGWVRQAEENPFTARLGDLLDTLRWYFERATRTVPRLGAGGRPEDELTAVLSLGPVPHAGGYRVRKVTGPVLGADMSAFNLASTTGTQQQVAQHVAQTALLRSDVQMVATRRLLGLTLDDLVDGTQFERMSLFDAEPMRSWVAHTEKPGKGPADYLRSLRESPIFRIVAAQAASNDLLYLLAERSLAMAGERDMMRLTGMLNPERFTAAASSPVEFASSGTAAGLARSDMFNQTIGVLAADAALVPGAMSQLKLTDVVFDSATRDALITAIGHDDKPPVNAFEGTSRAVRTLADFGGTELDDDGYTRLTSEALACASTRIDAWFTSLAMQRLDTLRSRRPTGVQLGAWGVLVDVRPDSSLPPPTDGPERWQAHLSERNLVPPKVEVLADPVGYLHAPSLQQAITAGILRAGELVHRGDGSTVASIDLTSKRARIARDLLNAMSNGQPLGALLGYRLERNMHAAGLHTEVSVLRQKYPQRRVAGAPGEVVDSGTDSVVPAEVLDGLDVWINRAGVVAQLGLPAALQPLLEELDQAVQAVADTLVADGVHQLASGRAEAAGATFAAVSEGRQPPKVTVLDEPRSGLTITHRLVLALDPDGGTPGWDRSSPRALLAPDAELWAEAVLGAATGIRVQVDGQLVPLDSLGLCALDVLVESRLQPNKVAELAARCTASEELLELARAAAEVLAASRPAVPADLATQHLEDDSIDAGKVSAVAPPGTGQLTPIAALIAEQLHTVIDAIAAINTLVAGPPVPATVDSAVLKPLARLGVPGSVQPQGAIDTALVMAAGSAADAVLRDVFRLVQQGQPNPATTPGAEVGAAGTGAPPRVDGSNWEAMLSAVCGSSTGIETLTRITRRLGGEPVVPTVAAENTLGAAVVDEVAQPDLEHWLSRTSRVRPALARFDDLCLFLEAAGLPAPELTPCHLPPTPDLAWLGGDLEELVGPANEHRRWRRPKEPHSHVVVAGTAALVSGATLRGLVVDEVAEVLPAPSVTTGLAVHYDAPNARAPQSILLAVPPDPSVAWSWQLLHETVSEAVALARLRGVDLDDLVPTGIEEFLPLTYLRDGMADTTPVSVLTDRPFWLADVVMANRVIGVRF
ncbi:MAG: hypothetical protein ABIR34_07540 [Marmoricola sp.]